MVDIKVPELGESVSEATISSWLKNAGDAVATDEPIVELETDKITVEINAPEAGVIAETKFSEGDTVTIGDIIATLDAGAEPAAAKNDSKPTAEKKADSAPAKSAAPKPSGNNSETMSPSAAKIAAENNVSASNVDGSGRDGRITKGDVLDYLAAGQPEAGPREERVKMTRLRQTIAGRLKDAQNTAAILTTFNEIDMTEVMALRSQHKDAFYEKHGVKLGFMSFFVKAVVSALRDLPAVNAEIDGSDVIYKNYYDISVAVGTDQGLVVPVVRDADRLSFAGVEGEIVNLAKKARDGKLTMAEMTGGTFTITNGGVYGSLVSTPIINPPQSGILGLHKIEKRPVVISGKNGDEIAIRPMMYIALSYDHRIIDGKEAVTFLVKVKEAMEDPGRLLLNV